jgi:hypothetical protein
MDALFPSDDAAPLPQHASVVLWYYKKPNPLRSSRAQSSFEGNDRFFAGHSAHNTRELMMEEGV